MNGYELKDGTLIIERDLTDLDLFVKDFLEILKKYFPISKKDRLKKYEARNEEIQIDIYLPFYSDLGIPVEEIIKEVGKIETFALSNPERLLILKQFAYGERKLSAKGQKDMLDIMSLLSNTEIDWELYKKLLARFKMENYSSAMKELLAKNTHIPQLNLNQHAYSRLKKEIIPHLK